MTSDSRVAQLLSITAALTMGTGCFDWNSLEPADGGAEVADAGSADAGSADAGSSDAGPPALTCQDIEAFDVSHRAMCVVVNGSLRCATGLRDLLFKREWLMGQPTDTPIPEDPLEFGPPFGGGQYGDVVLEPRGLFGCALDAQRRLSCWGTTAEALLGVTCSDGSQDPSPHALRQIHDTQVNSVELGFAHGCLTDASGVRCWGYDASGAAGHDMCDAPEGPSDRPVCTPTVVSNSSGAPLGTGYLGIATGNDFTCAFHTASMRPWCWGSGVDGRLGPNRDNLTPNCSTGGEVAWPMDDPLLTQNLIAAGDRHACIKSRSEGELQCWGSSEAGQAGDTTPPPRGTLRERVVPPGTGQITSLAAGAAHTCAIRGGTLSCWGSNDNGALGGDLVGRSFVTIPAPPQYPESRWDQVRAGANNTCAQLVLAAGHKRLFCWGNAYFGTGGPREICVNRN